MKYDILLLFILTIVIMTTEPFISLAENIANCTAYQCKLAKGRNFPNKRRRARRLLDNAISAYVIAYTEYYGRDDPHDMVWHLIQKYAFDSAMTIVAAERSLWS